MTLIGLMRLKRVLSLALWLHPLFCYSISGQDHLLLKVAREEKQRREGFGKPARMFSNEHLSKLPNARVTISVASEAVTGREELKPETKNG